MERQLASIQLISDITSIEGADRIETASVLGWKCVVNKGEFKVGDKCVFFEIDSVLPARDEFAFLKDRSYRIKTIKLRGQISQGLIMPLSILPDLYPEVGYCVGTDVTEILGVTKYESPICSSNPASHCKPKGSFPYFVPKTDEIRLQSVPEVLGEIPNTPLYISVKIDGTSFTAYYKDGQFGVCSRNHELQKDDNIYWRIADACKLEETMTMMGKNLAVQGELAGPRIQGNKLGLQEVKLFLFNIFDIDARKYYDYLDFIRVSSQFGIDTVPLLEIRTFSEPTLAEFLELARGDYSNNTPREGIVIRPLYEIYSSALKGRLSFKVVNNDFLLKYGG